MRLDQALVHRGLARSRTQAQTLITQDAVRVAGIVRAKASTPVDDETHIEIAGDHHYVSRAAGKLIAALDAFGIPVSGRVVLDAGASTGGFTQVLRERGAQRVYAVDVGHDQIAASIRADPGVVVIEGVNLRTFTAGDLETTDREREDRGVGDLTPGDVPHPAAQISLVVGDLSFISLTQVIGPLVEVLDPIDLVLLVKPQFEVGRGNLRRGGLVIDPDAHRAAITRVAVDAEERSLEVHGLVRSPVIGGTGNQEYLIWLRRAGQPGSAFDWRAQIDQVVAAAESASPPATVRSA